MCATGQSVALLPALLQMLHLHLLPALQRFHAVLLWRNLLYRLLPDLLLQPVLPATLLWTMDNGVQLLRNRLRAIVVCAIPDAPRLCLAVGSRSHSQLGSSGAQSHGGSSTCSVEYANDGSSTCAVDYAHGATNRLLPGILPVLPAAGLLAGDAGFRAFVLVRALLIFLHYSKFQPKRRSILFRSQALVRAGLLFLKWQVQRIWFAE